MNTTERDILTDPARKQLKLKGQLKILYSQSTITFIFPVIFSVILVFILRDVSNHRTLLVWVTVVILYSIARYIMVWLFFKNGIVQKDNNKWLDFFIISVCISGIVWGSAGIILIQYDPQHLVEFTLYNGLIMLTVCGLVAGAVVSYSINMVVLLFYSFPALVPPALYLISLGDKYNSALGGFVLLYFIFINLTAHRMNRQLLGFLQMEYEYQNLRQHYLKLHDQFEKINSRLKPKS